jgi:hypothetical protein
MENAKTKIFIQLSRNRHENQSEFRESFRKETEIDSERFKRLDIHTDMIQRNSRRKNN